MRARTFVPMLLLSLTLNPAAADQMRDIVFVANGEGGTVDLIDAETFSVIRSIDVTPDGDSPSLQQDPLQALAYPLIVRAAGENFAQDLDIAPDGRTLYVSRGHLGDVTAFDIGDGTMLWRTEVGGFRADHMTISADGRYLFISAITDSTVQVIDTLDAGRIVGSFPTGEWSHDNVLSPDGTRVYNGSIGNVLVPEEMRLDVPRPQNQITIADATTFEVVDTLAFERGVRPFVISADETRLYAQLSEFHGIVEYDLQARAIARSLNLPIDEGVTEDDYDFEAPHHGLAISPDGSLLCAAGRASDYAALVSTASMTAVSIIDTPDGPGWAANDPAGEHCYIANTRANSVTVISYATGLAVATIDAGLGPKYITDAQIPASVAGS